MCLILLNSFNSSIAHTLFCSVSLQRRSIYTVLTLHNTHTETCAREQTPRTRVLPNAFYDRPTPTQLQIVIKHTTGGWMRSHYTEQSTNVVTHEMQEGKGLAQVHRTGGVGSLSAYK